jgi:hypothetical protein
MRKFGSTVGISVCTEAGAGGVDVEETGSITGAARGVPVGVQGMGWKGVGVGEAFGLDVTITKGGGACPPEADALLPHPASRKAARMSLQ